MPATIQACGPTSRPGRHFLRYRVMYGCQNEYYVLTCLPHQWNNYIHDNFECPHNAFHTCHINIETHFILDILTLFPFCSTI